MLGKGEGVPGGHTTEAKQGQAHTLKGAGEGLGMRVGGEELKGGVHGTLGMKDDSCC